MSTERAYNGRFGQAWPSHHFAECRQVTVRVMSMRDAGGGAPRSDHLAAAQSDVDLTILVPRQTAVGAETAWQIETPAESGQVASWFPSLREAVARLKPDVLHVATEPEWRLALRGASVCSRSMGLVVETNARFGSCGGFRSGLGVRWRARRVLSRADALIVHHSSGLAAVRQLGFTGFGVIAGRRIEPATAAQRAEARRSLELPSAEALVLGWGGELHARSGIFDLLEALAMSDDVHLLIPASGPALQEVIDRADALEIVHRVRCVAGAPGQIVRGSPLTLADYPLLTSAADLICLPPKCNKGHPAACRCALESAEAAGLPVLYPDCTSIASINGGGWPVRLTDPADIAALLTELQADRTLLLTAAGWQRQGPPCVAAAATELSLAIHAAHHARHAAGPGRGVGRAARPSGFGGKRQPSRT